MEKQFLKTVIAATLLLQAAAFTQTISNMTMVSRYEGPNNVYHSKHYASVWGYVAPNGKEYALLTVEGTNGTANNGGVSIVDMSTPSAPVERAYVTATGSLWHELKTYRNYMYLCTDQYGSDGMKIVDLSGLTNATPSVQELTAYHTSGSQPVTVNRCHNLWVDSTHNPPYLYVQNASTSNGVLILSLANPASPTYVGRIAVECHDMYANNSVRPNRVYVSTGYTRTWDAYDITNVASPTRISRITFANVTTLNGTALNEVTANTYSHNIWLSQDGNYAFTTQETDRTTVKAWDISGANETAPKLVGTWIGSSLTYANVIAHNVLIRRNLMYVPHYSGGLWVVDISNPAAMVTKGYHRPSSATAQFSGSWGAYNWFPSGLLIHGDMEDGLYIVNPDASFKQTGTDPVSVAPSISKKGLSISRLNGQSVQFDLPKTGEYLLSILNPAGKTVYSFHGKGAQGYQIVPMDNRLASGSYVASLRQNDAYTSTALTIQH
jgi:choice-of-anchor B domain-containing protein